MSDSNIVHINGRAYDALTGRLMDHSHAPKEPSQPPKRRAFSDVAPAAHGSMAAKGMHQKPQKSQTLIRSVLKKPQPMRQLTPAPVKVEADYAQTPKTHHRSSSISKFGPSHHTAISHAAQPTQASHHSESVRPPRQHPVVTKAMAHHPTAHQATRPQSSHGLKEALIRERLQAAQPAHTQHQRKRYPRLTTILTSSLALLLLAGYLTYINLPNISMRVAATRAGVAANYPNYQPDGYHFSGPITYQPGQVTIQFKSNTSDHNFTIRQKSSTWDSQAVLDNYVSKQTGTYLTYQEHGLTIYSFSNHAAWVNGGILYSIDGDAPLSSDQLLHIATSM